MYHFWNPTKFLMLKRVYIYSALALFTLTHKVKCFLIRDGTQIAKRVSQICQQSFKMSQVSYCLFLSQTATPSFLRSLPSSRSSMFLTNSLFWVRNVKAEYLPAVTSVNINYSNKMLQSLKCINTQSTTVCFIHMVFLIQPEMVYIHTMPFFHLF